MEKRIKSRKEGERINKEKEKNRTEKEIIIALVIMAVAIAGFFVFLWVFKTYSVSFTYHGLKFTKEAYGKMIIYHTKINLNRQGEGKFQYNLYLKNDPRKLEKIPADFAVLFTPRVIITFDPEVDTCPDASLAGLALGDFFSAIGVKAIGATTDEKIANETKKPFVTCENTLNATIVYLTKAGNSSIIESEDNINCFILNINNCEILPVSERFVLASFTKMLGTFD